MSESTSKSPPSPPTRRRDPERCGKKSSRMEALDDEHVDVVVVVVLSAALLPLNLIGASRGPFLLHLSLSSSFSSKGTGERKKKKLPAGSRHDCEVDRLFLAQVAPACLDEKRFREREGVSSDSPAAGSILVVGPATVKSIIS